VPAVWSELNAGVHKPEQPLCYRYAQLVGSRVEGGSAEGARYVQSWTNPESLADAIEAELTPSSSSRVTNHSGRQRIGEALARPAHRQ